MTPEYSLDRAIAEITSDLASSVIDLRRDIHRFPELAGTEHRTAALVAGRLRAAGLTVTTGVGGHGVIAVLDGAGDNKRAAGDGPTVAYRADMDAVGPLAVMPYPPSGGIHDGGFASAVPGVAHLCGHDLHTAIGVGVAEALARIHDRLPGRVVFFFQPAEETIEGARAMIEAGALEQHRPAEIYALHCGPFPVGTFAVMPGFGLPGVDQFQLAWPAPNSTGDAGHRAQEADRLAAAIAALSTVELPPTLAEFERMVVELQRPDTALARFVTVRCGAEVTDGHVTVGGALKAWPDDRYPDLREQIATLAESAGASVEFLPEPFPGMVCSPDLTHAAATYLRRVLRPDAVITLHASPPFFGEDFALFLQKVPGAMFFLGVANEAEGIAGIPHMPDFAADERAIGIGVRAMAGLLSHRLMRARTRSTTDR